MSKFKVGDVVEWNGTRYTVQFIDEHCLWLTSLNFSGRRTVAIQNPSLLTLIYSSPFTRKTKSPVVEKVVKSIEPGIYGRVVIDSANSENINFKLLSYYGKESRTYSFTASELESAAQTFLELAKFLREKE